MLKKHTLLISLFFLVLGKAYSQIKLSKNTPIKKCLIKIEKQTDYTFSYSETAIDVNQKLNKSFKNSTLNVFLNYLYQAKNIKSSINNKQVLLFPGKNKKIKIISGYIKDSITKEVLIFASIFDNISKKGTTTNEYGYYSLATKKDSLNLTISYVGYPKKHKLITLKQDKNSDILLSPNNDLKEIIITGNKSELSNKQGIIELNPEDYKKAPTLKGENDPIQTLTLLPGVTEGDNENYIHIRGGTIGENMILLDGVPLYKMTHAGKISVVNGDVINKTTLYKSNFPSRFSGRTSSILDFRINNGNAKKTKAIGNIGFQAAKIALDGPIGKKMTYLLSARRNYGGIFKNIVGRENSYSHFYDLYGKLNFNHKKGNIAISSFFDSDKTVNPLFFYLDNNDSTKEDLIEKVINHTNKVFSGFVSLQSNTRLENKLFWNSQATYYDYAIQNENAINDTLLNSYSNSHIQDAIFNNYFLYTTENHNVNFGLNYTYHNMFTIFDSDSLYYRENVDLHDANLFIEDNFRHKEKWNFRIGSSLSFYSFGKDIFLNFNPRLGATYKLNQSSNFAASFSRLAQYFHLIPFSFNEDTPYSSEIWQSSSSNFPPLTSTNFALSYHNSTLPKIPFSIEGYYKFSQAEKNVIESDFNKLFFGIESNAFNGVGHNYGLEFLIEKKGKLSGWFNYTLAWSKKKFSELNENKSFPSPYDRRHKINIVANYNITKKININANWTLQSGTPFYLKLNNINQLDTLIVVNEAQFKGIQNINENDLLKGKYYNLPTYNLFNIQLTFSKEKKWGTRIWQLGMKNIFNTKKLHSPKYGKKDGNLVLFFRSTNEQVFSNNFYPYITYRFIIK